MEQQKRRLELAVLKEKLKGIKLKNYLTECKLVIAFFGAISTVTVFFYKVFWTGIVKVEMAVVRVPAAGGGRLLPVPPVDFDLELEPLVTWVDVMLVTSFVISLGLMVYYGIKTWKKYWGKQ